MSKEKYVTLDDEGVWVIEHCSDEKVAEFVESKTSEENVSVVDTGTGKDDYADVKCGVVWYEVEDEPEYTVQTNPFAVSELVRNAILAITTLTEDEVDELTMEQQIDVYEQATDKLEDVYGEE